MKFLPRLLFIEFYALGVLILFSRLLKLAGLPIEKPFFWIVSILWLSSCSTGFLWLAPLALTTYRLRKPILEEEEWLHPLLHELSLRTGLPALPRLYILEEPQIDAFVAGKNRIVLSRGLLVQLNEREVKAVLAHELGHLRDGDTLAETAFKIAGSPLLILYRALLLFWKPLKRTQKAIMRVLIMAVVSSVLWLITPDLGLLLVFLFTFRLGYPFLDLIIRTSWCWFSRKAEYRQDGFAQSLGCGRALKSALLKIDSLHSSGLVRGWQQVLLTHPMLYRRIRRLEWLEGLRPEP